MQYIESLINKEYFSELRRVAIEADIGALETRGEIFNFLLNCLFFNTLSVQCDIIFSLAKAKIKNKSNGTEKGFLQNG